MRKVLLGAALAACAVIGFSLGERGIDVSWYFVANLALLAAFGYLNIPLHEAGHVLCGRLAGLEILSVRLGNGRVLAKPRILGIPVILTSNLRGGLTFIGRSAGGGLRARYFLMTCGGSLAIGVVTALVAVFAGFRPRWFFAADRLTGLGVATSYVFAGLLTLLVSLLPYASKAQGYRNPNDGLRLWRLLARWQEMERELLAGTAAGGFLPALERRDYVEAERVVREVLRRYPEQTACRLNLGIALLKQLRVEEAIREHEALRQEGCDKRYEGLLFNNLAWMYLLQGGEEPLDKGLELSAAALAQYPRYPLYLNTRGCLLVARGKVEEGLKLLTASSRLGRRIDETVNTPIGYAYAAYGFFQAGDLASCRQYLHHLATFRGKWEPDSSYLYKQIREKTREFSPKIPS